MRLISLFMAIGLLQVSASTYSQSAKISISGKNLTIEEVFGMIENQSEFSFFYTLKQVELSKRVDVSIENQSVNKVLKQVLKGTEMTYTVNNRLIVVHNKNEAGSTETPAGRQKSVSGKVRDNSGLPLPGVTIVVKGTTHGTVSNTNGEYSLGNVPEDAILQFSFVGMKTTEIAVAGRSFIEVTLEDQTIGIDEVVVVGYGIQKKAHVTGSVAQINSDELSKAPKATVSSMLAGKLPGLVARQNSGQPGSDQSAIMIRGFGTFNNSSPLILVDGIERNFNTIDPNDIESVTVLKDAAASAVYGVRAAHGVVLVTTKRGGADQKSNITYNGSYTMSYNTRFPKFLNGPDYARWHNKARELDGQIGYYRDSDIEKIANGDPEGRWGNTDWLGALFKDFGETKKHNISANGGNKKIQYYIGGGILDQKGIIEKTNFERYSLRSNLDINATEDIKVSFNLSGRKEQTDNPGFRVSPFSAYNPITLAIRALPVIPKEYEGFPTATGMGFSTNSPLATVEKSGFNRTDRYIFESSASVQYFVPFVKGLSLKMLFSYDQDFVEQRSFLTPFSVNKFTPSTQTYAVTRADGTAEYSSLFQSSSNGSRTLARPSIEYSNEIGQHNFGGLFLYEFRESKGSNMQAQRRRFLLSSIPELTFAQEDVPNSIRGESGNVKIAGYVGRLNYAYGNKYLAEFSFRYDGSYKFHKDYRWGFFPSLSLGWTLSEEDFFKNTFSKIDRFKFRISAGELGSDNISPFLYKRSFNLTTNPNYAFGTDPTPGYALYSANSVPSYDLSWEKTRTINGGFEIVAWKGLLSAEMDVFYKYTFDILQGVTGLYPPSLANNFQTIENSGVVDVRGFELLLGHQNRIGEIDYRLSGNISWARNKILERTQQDNIPSWQNIIGKPIGGIYGFHATGLYQTDEQIINRPTGPGGVQRLGDLMYEDYNGDGKIDLFDQVRIARSPIPEMMFSFSGDMNWKGLDVGFQLQGAAIADVIISGLYPNGIMDQTEFARAFYGAGNSPYYLVENSWTPENRDAKYPRLGESWNGNNGWTSDWWVVNGAYLRLKQVNLGYTLPKRVASTIRAERIRLSVNGSNLYTWDALDFLDPEMPNNNNGYYPQQKTYTFGVDVTF